MRTYLVLDTGLFVEQAAALSDGGKNRVLYWTPWASWSPMYQQYATGKYFKDIEKIYYYEEYLDEVLKNDGCLVNFDVANNGLIGWLRDKYPAASIVGSGWGQKLEDDRVYLKKLVDKLGLPQKHYDVIYGLEGPKGLREYLKKNDKVYVKLNKFRGELESFYSRDYKSVEMKLDKMAVALGPHKSDNNPKTAFPFVCEELIEAEVESGFDGFFDGKEFVSPCFCGFEWQKGPYCAKVIDYEDLPEPIFETMEAFKPILQEMGYRGSFSTEEKILSPKEHYLLDVCSRMGSPLSQIYPRVIKNYADAIYRIGRGEETRFEIDVKYVALYPVKDVVARNDYVNIHIKDKNKASGMFSTGSPDGEIYAVKGLEEIGTIMATGDTVEEASENLDKNKENLSSPDADMTGIETIGLKFKELFDAARKVGVDL